MKPDFDLLRPDEDHEKLFLKIFSQFLYLYAHLAYRAACVHLSEREVLQLTNYLYPVIVESVTGCVISADCPKDIRTKVTQQFVLDMMAAGTEYAQLKGDSVFHKLAQNVARLLNADNDATMVKYVSNIAL